MRHYRPLSIALLASLTAWMLPACSQSSAPITPATTPAIGHSEHTLPAWQHHRDSAQGLLGHWRLDIEGHTAELAPVRTALANDDLYFLGIDAFLQPDSLRLRGIERAGTTLRLTWQFTHPFPAPVDFDAPPSAGNRADLAIAGRVLVLADVDPANLSQQTFFGDVIANTRVLANPHGYMQPKGLLPATGGIANTYPYQLLVDDGANAGVGTRVAQTNTTPYIGNFDPGIGGWQRANAGFARDNWTGYGILHQGQASTGTLAIDLTQISDARFSVDLAVIAKYQDPRGVPDPRSKRLPAPNPDPFTFAYRMPHGALDCEWIAVTPGDDLPGLDPTATTEMTVRVRDWDARAAVTSETDVSLDPQVNTIANGASGIPAVDISTPGVSAIIATGSEVDPGVRSGLPDDEIAYTVLVTATEAPEDGVYPALIRVSDPERTAPSYRDYTYDLAPGLVPITDPAQQVAPITYMGTLLVVSSGPNNPPTCDGVVPSTGFLEPGGTFTVNLSQIVDDSTNLKVSFDYTGPATSSTSVATIPYSGIGSETAFDPFTDSRLTQKLLAPTILGSYQLTVHLSDNINDVDCGPFPFIVGIPGECPTVTSSANSLGPFIWDVDNPDFTSLAFAIEEDMDSESGIGQNDLAGVRDLSGDLVIQGNITQQFWRWNYDTDEATALTTAGYPGTGFANRAHTFEIDHNERVLWVASNVTQGIANSGLEPAEIYPNAGTVIRFFDTSGGPASADKGTINVGQRVIAMAIDQFDNVWALDHTNTMHKYSGAAGGTTYTEDTSATFNLGTSSGGVITGAVVEDFDIDFFNQAFFVLVRGSATNYNVWRFECDGQHLPSIQGNPNPATNVFAGETCDRGDIVIDNYGTNMTVLTGPQDAQIILTGDNGPGPEVLGHDGGVVVTLTARMQKSSIELGEDGAGRTSFLYASNLMVTTESLSDDQWAETWLEVWIPPNGWQ